MIYFNGILKSHIFYCPCKELLTLNAPNTNACLMLVSAPLLHIVFIPSFLAIKVLSHFLEFNTILHYNVVLHIEH